MFFVDTNVFMYAVGRAHPLKDEARAFLTSAVADPGVRLCTSAEALQELLHAYIPVGRIETLDAALLLVQSVISDIWPLEPEDVAAARDLINRHAGLGARDLLHLASCRRRGVTEVKSYDRALCAAFGK